MAAVTERSRFGEIIWPVLAWIVAIIFFFPIFWLVFTSFKTDADAVKPEHLLFFTPTLENYANMTENYDYWRFAINSVITSTFATLFALAVGVKNFLGIFDTHFLVILVLCLINLPIAIWMLFTYFKEIPKEIIEASKMDGVTTWGEIKDILIPLAWGGVASTQRSRQRPLAQSWYLGGSVRNSWFKVSHSEPSSDASHTSVQHRRSVEINHVDHAA